MFDVRNSTKERWKFDRGDRTWRSADGIESGVANSNVLSIDTLVEMEKQVHDDSMKDVPYEKKEEFVRVGLDPNHSHFILVETDKYEHGKGFGCETQLRASLQNCLADNSYLRRTPTDVEKQYSIFKRPPKRSADDSEDDVPLVLVCVQGGIGTIDTVLQAVRAR